MKLASLKQGRDGRLVVVSRDLARAADAGDIAATMQQALDNWANAEPRLAELAAKLEVEDRSRIFNFARRTASRLCRAPFNGSTVRPM